MPIAAVREAWTSSSDFAGLSQDHEEQPPASLPVPRDSSTERRGRGMNRADADNRQVLDAMQPGRFWGLARPPRVCHHSGGGWSSCGGADYGGEDEIRMMTMCT